MSPTAVFVWRAVALVLFAIVMGGVWWGAEWFANTIPTPALALFVGLMVGGSVGFLMGARSERRQQHRL